MQINVSSEEAGRQGFLAESDFLRPAPSRGFPIGRPVAAARYAVSAEKENAARGQHIRQFH